MIDSSVWQSVQLSLPAIAGGRMTSAMTKRKHLIFMYLIQSLQMCQQLVKAGFGTVAAESRTLIIAHPCRAVQGNPVYAVG